MEINRRKIQKFAKYSYAITLPKYWIQKHGLEPKTDSNSSSNTSSDAIINMFEQPDGSLALYPTSLEKSAQSKVFLFDLDEVIKKNPKFIEQKGIQLILISYYMNGAAGVEIISKGNIPKKLIEQIEQAQERLLFNWNLNQVSNHKLLIKNVFSESPENIFQEEIPRYIRECFSILIWMLDDLQDALKTESLENLPSLNLQDQKIDRYYFFIVRQIRTIFEHPQISKPLNYSHKKLIDLRLLAKIIEDVGDNLKEIASILVNHYKIIVELNLLEYLQDFFVIIHDEFGILADLLRDFVSEKGSSIGMNENVMSLIQKFRRDGAILETKWMSLAPNTQLIQDGHTFYDYYRVAGLIENLESVFKIIFDFTNIFF
ncbi:MAG: PhoU domain-containing protein [Promethearchaeota archaeon]